jgi:hypothetical protein
LAAIRMCFDWLVTGGVLATNPAHAVRGPKHVVKRGKTPVLTSDQARALLEGIDTSTLVGLRDRALIGVMTYAFARIGAVVAMRVEDYFANGKRWWVRLHEKGGKRHEMPAHHKLEAFLDEYIKAAGIGQDGKSPLFRSAAGRTGLLNGEAMHRIDAYRMIQRRAAELGMKVKIGGHTFRATGITAYLEAKSPPGRYSRPANAVTCTAPSPCLRLTTTVQRPGCGRSTRQNANWRPEPSSAHLPGKLDTSSPSKTTKPNSFLPVPSSSAFMPTRSVAAPAGISIVKRASGAPAESWKTFRTGSRSAPLQSGLPHIADERLPSPAASIES